jgi:putative hemolysin
VRARVYQPLNLLAPKSLEPRAALAAMPPLIRAYLRLGGVVGDGAFIDHDFQTTDVCVILDTARMTAQAKGLLATASGTRARR